MDTDLRELFDSSFHSEPPLRPVDDMVGAGRRALRRRRMVMAAAVGVAAGAIVIGVTAQLAGGPSSGAQPIERPQRETPAQVEARLTGSTPVDKSWRPPCDPGNRPYCDSHAYALDAAPVSIRADGMLVRVGVEVIIARRAVDATPAPGTRRFEVEVRTPESIHSRWYVVTRDARGDVAVEKADPSVSQIDFDTWASAINRGVDIPGAPPRSPPQVLTGS